jgi:hypothetical protein
MRASGSKPIAPRHLLPDIMLVDEERHSAGSFKTKAEWDAHKMDLARMSGFLEKVYGQLERGERRTMTNVNADELIRRHVRSGG